MEDNKNYSPFKEVGIKEVDKKVNESGFLKVKYNTRKHPDDRFTAYIRPKALQKFGQPVVEGGYYSVIADGEYINYIGQATKPNY